MATHKFDIKANPGKYGFVADTSEGESGEYFRVAGEKILYRLHHWNYEQGVMSEFEVVKNIFKDGGVVVKTTIFAGKIPTEEFAKELFKNIL